MDLFSCYDFFFFFLLWTIFKVFIEFVTILFLFWGFSFLLFFWFFGHEACGILAPQPGAEPILLASEGEVLITRLPGKSLMAFLFLSLMSLGGVCLSAPKEIPCYPGKC